MISDIYENDKDIDFLKNAYSFSKVYLGEKNEMTIRLSNYKANVKNIDLNDIISENTPFYINYNKL